MLVRAASMSVEFYDILRSIYGEEGEATSVAHSLLFDIAHAMGLADAHAFAERTGLSDPMTRLAAGPLISPTPAGPSSSCRPRAWPP